MQSSYIKFKGGINMVRRIVEQEGNGITVVRVVDNDPYNKMFYLLYDRGMRNPYKIADELNYKVSFVERYIKSLRKRGWIIEEGKKMELK